MAAEEKFSMNSPTTNCRSSRPSATPSSTSRPTPSCHELAHRRDRRHRPGAEPPVGGDVKSFCVPCSRDAPAWSLSSRTGPPLSVRIAAPMAVDPSEILSRVRPQRALDRPEQAAFVAAREAWADAGFSGKAAGLDPTRVAVW